MLKMNSAKLYFFFETVGVVNSYYNLISPILINQ